MRKKALVTGASRGIGKAIALVLAQEGYDVAISYASKLDEALQTADDIKKCGGEAYVFQAYLQNHGAGKLLFDQAVEALGDLDLLVNNAGLTICEPLQEITEANLDLLLDLDFRNYILMMEYAVQYMMKKRARRQYRQYHFYAQPARLSRGRDLWRPEGGIEPGDPVLCFGSGGYRDPDQ